jgi:hypothetical protein
VQNPAQLDDALGFNITTVFEGVSARLVDHLRREALMRGYLVPASLPLQLGLFK